MCMHVCVCARRVCVCTCEFDIGQLWKLRIPVDDKNKYVSHIHYTPNGNTSTSSMVAAGQAGAHALFHIHIHTFPGQG
jgi:hypothetical protein